MVEKKQQQSGSLGSIGRGYTPPSPGSTNERDFTIGSFTAKTNSPSTATTSTHHLKTQSRFVTQEMHTGASSSSNHLTAQAQVGVPQSAEQNNAEGQQLRLEDDLTGAFKFEYLVHRLEYEVLRSRIVGGPLSVMVVSINRFSEIGITFGALALDSSMQELTKITNANLRALDLMGIYNEGKLIIVCPHTSLALAKELCNTLAYAVSTLKLTHQWHEFGIRVSCGISELSNEIPDAESLIALADLGSETAEANQLVWHCEQE